VDKCDTQSDSQDHRGRVCCCVVVKPRVAATKLLVPHEREQGMCEEQCMSVCWIHGVLRARGVCSWTRWHEEIAQLVFVFVYCVLLANTLCCPSCEKITHANMFCFLLRHNYTYRITRALHMHTQTSAVDDGVGREPEKVRAQWDCWPEHEPCGLDWRRTAFRFASLQLHCWVPGVSPTHMRAHTRARPCRLLAFSSLSSLFSPCPSGVIFRCISHNLSATLTHEPTGFARNNFGTRGCNAPCAHAQNQHAPGHIRPCIQRHRRSGRHRTRRCVG